MRLMSVIFRKHQQGQNCDCPLVCVPVWVNYVSFKVTELFPYALFFIPFQHLVQELPAEKISLSRCINTKKLFQCLRTSQLASQHSWFLIIWGDNRWKVTLRWEQASFSLHPERRRVLSTSERHGIVNSEITEVGEDLKDWVTWWSQHCHIPNHHTHTFSEQFQGCPRQLIPALENPLCEEIILIPKLILTWCNLRPSPLVLSAVRGQKRSPPMLDLWVWESQGEEMDYLG